MPSKKKKYNARFPAGRIKKIMQSDEEVGKVAQAVPIIISRTLELFVESMLTKTLRITNARNAKTLSPSHMKQCIMSESRFDFLRELVKNVPDINVAEEQLAADNDPERRESTTSEDTTSPPLQQTTMDTYGSSSSCSNGRTLAATNRNGAATKRHHEPDVNAGGSASSSLQWKYNKQYSLDCIANKLSANADSVKSQNFYRESTADDNMPINYSIKASADNKNHAPKLNRVDSAPASYLPNTYPPSSVATTAAAACFMPVTTTKMSANDQPIINFDFTKIPLLPFASSASTSEASSPSLSSAGSPYIPKATIGAKTVPELMPINNSNTSKTTTATTTTSKHSHSVANILKPDNKCQTSTSRTEQKSQHHLQSPAPQQPPQQTTASQPPKQRSVSHKSLPSRSFSHTSTSSLLASTLSSVPSPSSSSSVLPLPSSMPSNRTGNLTTAPSTTSKSLSSTAKQKPVVNINFNTSSVTPTISYSIPSTAITNSSMLDMDEDYDNI